MYAIDPGLLAAARKHIEKFNRNDEEGFRQAVDNASAWEWLRERMPLFECPDPLIEETFYFRWWTYRKHLKETPDGTIITEFHAVLGHAGKHNSINCACGPHFYEGRWLAQKNRFLDDYARFWFRGGGSLRAYSAWLSDAIWQTCLVSGDFSLAVDLLPDMVENYRAWERGHLHSSGLFWSDDDRDGMEFSISGPGLRPTLNSYMAADATAIAAIGQMAGRPDVAEEFTAKGELLAKLINERLWDEQDQFYKTVPLESKDTPVATWDFRRMDPNRNVREQVGFIPWAFRLAVPGRGAAWAQLTDPQGLAAPFGPLTAERRHPRFMFEHSTHECLWNGPSWPFATSQTLMGLATLLATEDQPVVTKADYLATLQTYARSHYRELPDGRIVSWVDENLDPFTGEWLSRRMLESWGWCTDKGGYERGKDYNHSTFCDLVISGLIGFRPGLTGGFEIRPLVPAKTWNYFCLDNLRFRGQRITIRYDADGTRYGQGRGLQVFADGIVVAGADELTDLMVGA